MVDFSAILDKRLEDVKEPKSLPPGTYHGTICEKPDIIESTQKKTPGVVLVFELHEADDDVDEDLLAEAGGLRNTAGQARKVRNTYWYIASQENFGWELASMCKDLGIDEGSWREVFDKLLGEEVTLTLKHRIDGDRVYVDVKNVTARK